MNSEGANLTAYLIRMEKVDSLTSVGTSWNKHTFLTSFMYLPPQFMIFLTVVVERICLLLRKSAICPPIGTIIVITKCGTADSMPTWCKTERGEIYVSISNMGNLIVS